MTQGGVTVCSRGVTDLDIAETIAADHPVQGSRCTRGKEGARGRVVSEPMVSEGGGAGGGLVSSGQVSWSKLTALDADF